MNTLIYFIGPGVAAVIVGVIMSRIFRNEEKVDKGFSFFYHKLTYRRRMIRALWGIPILFLFYLAIYGNDYLNSHDKITIGIIFLVAFLIDVTINYMKWKKYEKEV